MNFSWTEEGKRTSLLSITISLTQRKNMFSPWLSFSFLQNKEKEEGTPGSESFPDKNNKAVITRRISKDVSAPTWESKSTAELPLDLLIQTYGCKASKAAQNLNVWHQEGHQLHGLLQCQKQHCQGI